MMTLTNYGIGRNKDQNTAKMMSKALQVRNKAESHLRQYLKTNFILTKTQRSDIITLIKDYYSRIPLEAIIWNKYQVKQALYDTVYKLDDKFDPYKTRDAFNHIEAMLANLVQHPWHKEFHRIYTYSGSYRLNLSEHLIDVDEVFIAAGFKREKEFPLHLTLPIDKLPAVDEMESVLSVSFDCLLASVFCTNLIDVKY